MLCTIIRFDSVDILTEGSCLMKYDNVNREIEVSREVGKQTHSGEPETLTSQRQTSTAYDSSCTAVTKWPSFLYSKGEIIVFNLNSNFREVCAILI